MVKVTEALNTRRMELEESLNDSIIGELPELSQELLSGIADIDQVHEFFTEYVQRLEVKVFKDDDREMIQMQRMWLKGIGESALKVKTPKKEEEPVPQMQKRP